MIVGLHLFNLGLEWMWSGSSSHHCPYLTHTHTHRPSPLEHVNLRAPEIPIVLEKSKFSAKGVILSSPNRYSWNMRLCREKALFRKPRPIDKINLERCDSERNFILGLQPILQPPKKVGTSSLKRNSPIRFFRPTFFS